LVKKK